MPYIHYITKKQKILHQIIESAFDWSETSTSDVFTAVGTG